jgi:hypothetical protein
MKEIKILLCVCSLMMFASCGGGAKEPEIPEEVPEEIPEEIPEPEPVVHDNYIEFKYNGKDYQIANDVNCIYTRRGDDYYIISGSTDSTRQAFTLVIGRSIEQGVSYDIYASTPPYVVAAIRILFTEGETLAEESWATEDMSQVGIIGKLSITELTDSRMTGTFSCKTTTGEITDGKFTVKAKEYE